MIDCVQHLVHESLHLQQDLHKRHRLQYNCEHAIIDTGHVNVNIVDNDLLFCIANIRVGYQDATGHRVQVGGLFLVLKHNPNLTLTILAEQVVGASYEYLNE